MVHVEPDEQGIAAPQRQVLNDFVYPAYRGVVVEILEMGGEIHAAQRTRGGEVYPPGEGLEAPSSVKARLLEEPSEAGEDGGGVGGRDDGAAAVGLYDISALVRQ